MNKLAAILLLALLPCIGYGAQASLLPNRIPDFNLVNNGSFEAGNSGFVTECSYSHGDIFHAGDYDVTDDPHNAHSSASSYGDHTTGTGMMMVINGFQGASSVLWSETINVSAHATYEFVAWASLWSAGTPAELDFLFNGTSVGVLSTGTTAAQWMEFDAIWQSQQSTTLTIQVVELLQYGADLALDDIELHPSLRIDVTDVPGDQGGELQASWIRHSHDSVGASPSVTGYAVQRFDGNWQTLTTVSAAQVDSYSIIVPTTDVFTSGQAAPYARYRVIASTTNPAVLYASTVDSAYSIDNLPPPKPHGFLVEGNTWRLVVCDDPAIADLAQICFYRGTTSGFEPAHALSCSASALYYNEDQLNNFYYRIQFTDTHGNLSEFSDELALQFPSGSEPTQYITFALGQNQPNPFNPSTTIKFSLPHTDAVCLNIYDVSGRLIRNLLESQVMNAGHHERLWDGRDQVGRWAPAGVYFYKLVVGDFVDVKRMALVK